jgi:hypothetical protein
MEEKMVRFDLLERFGDRWERYGFETEEAAKADALNIRTIRPNAELRLERLETVATDIPLGNL